MTMTAKNKKEALLQAAKELFGECGYVETTFKKISDRAGVALGLLTHHYGNKEKLFLASGLDVLEHFLVKLRQATADAACGYDAVMHFCKAYLDFSVDKDSNWLVLVRCSPYCRGFLMTSAPVHIFCRETPFSCRVAHPAAVPGRHVCPRVRARPLPCFRIPSLPAYLLPRLVHP